MLRRVGLAHPPGRRPVCVRLAALWLVALVLALAVPGRALAAGGKSSSSASASVSSTASAPAPTPSPATPSPTGANGNPFGGVTPVSPDSTTSATPTATAANSATSGNGSFSGASVLAIVIGALVVLGGISYFIWYDARRRAPTRGARGSAGSVNAPGEGRRSGSKAPAKPRKLSQAERRRRKRGRARR